MVTMRAAIFILLLSMSLALTVTAHPIAIEVARRGLLRGVLGLKQQAFLAAGPVVSPAAWPDRPDTSQQQRQPQQQPIAAENATVADPAEKEEPAPKGIVGKLVHKLKQDARRTYRKASSLDPVRMMEEDMNLLVDFLMPGKRPSLNNRRFELLLVILGLIWFTGYEWKIFQSDRDETLDRWKGVPREKIEDSYKMQPDLVLVFHHPDFKRSDKDSHVTRASLQRVLVCRSVDENHGGKHLLHKTYDLMRKCTDSSFVRKLKTLKTRGLDDGQSPPSVDSGTGFGRQASGSDVPEEHHEPVTLGKVRTTLLQDVYDLLSSDHRGFYVDVFASVDFDELHVCVSLHKEVTIRRMLQLNHMKLQIQKWVVQEELKIDQPANEAESSPPYVQYNTSLAGNCLGEGKTDFNMFKVFGQAATSSGKGTILAGQQRVQLLYRFLNKHLDLDYAVEQRMLVQWFPAHNTSRLADLRACWARWDLLKDFSFVQPTTMLRDYFGSRLAFISAWNGHYCKMLLALTPVAVIFELANVLLLNHISVIGFSLILAVWGKWALNLWDREQEYSIVLWDLHNVHKEESPRADFEGTLFPSHIDRNIMELYYPKWKYTLRVAISWVITALFCGLNCFTVLIWMDLFEGRLGIPAIIVQAIIVQVFTQTFNKMSEALTNAENHKYQEHYYNSYLAKMFIFQFVNQYCAFFYIAVKQQFTKSGCIDSDCVGMIRKQLPIQFLVIAAIRVVQVVLATLNVEIQLWQEKREIVRAGGDPPRYCFVEKQSKFGKFRIREQIEVMTQLSLTLGYVLIFGAIVPTVVPLCFLVFAVQLRAGAVLVCTAANRTVPRASLGIGVWRDVIHCLMFTGIFFSGYLLVQFEPMFAGAMILTKLTCLTVYSGTLILVFVVIDWMIPKRTPSVQTLEGRRDHTAKKLQEKVEKKILTRLTEQQKLNLAREDSLRSEASGLKSHVQNVKDSQWGQISTAIPKSPTS